VIAAIALDMALAEGDGQVRYVASPASPLPESDLASYQRQVRGAADDQPPEWHAVPGPGPVAAALAAAARGARGLVLVRPAGGGQVRHVLNVYRGGDGRVRFLDGQLGKEVDPAADLGPGQLVFTPLTPGIAVPDGAAPARPGQAGLAGAASPPPEAGDRDQREVTPLPGGGTATPRPAPSTRMRG
jgi:hypothetical protein